MIIKSIKFGEGHKILSAYTKELGKIEITAFGARKPKSKLANKTQLFNHVKFFLYRSKEQEPYTVKDIEALEYFNVFKKDFTRYIAANCIVEPILKLIGKDQKDIEIFNLLLQSFSTLNIINEKKLVYLLLMYEIKLISLLGYRFNLELCSICGNFTYNEVYIDSYKGFPLCKNCKSENSVRLNEGTVNFIKWAQNEQIYKSIKVTMNQNTLNNLMIAVNKIYEYLFNISMDSWKYIESLEVKDN